MTDAPRKGWISAHLHAPVQIYSAELDEVILEAVAPFVATWTAEGIIKRYFFVRYGDGGPHVRVRMFGNHRDLAERVRPAFEESVHEWARRAGTRADTALRWIDYEPETDRYGGDKALPVAERFFHASSVAVLATLPEFRNGDRSHRLGAALAAMVVFAHAAALRRTSAAQFLDGFARSMIVGTRGAIPAGPAPFDSKASEQSSTLAPMVSAIWNALDEKQSIEGAIGHYARAARTMTTALERLYARGRVRRAGMATMSWGQCVGMIGSSLIHMTNNRFGVSPIEEAYLATVATRALSSV